MNETEAANSTIIQVLNPYAQLAWVSPESAGKISTKLYVEAGTLAFLMWDIILHIPEDYKMLRTRRINFLTVVYLFARFMNLVQMICDVIISTAPIGDCDSLVHYLTFVFPIGISFSILHFVFRVHAIYQNKYVFGFFMFSWVTIFGTSMLVPIASQGQRLGPTKYCVEVLPDYAIKIPALFLFVHDTLIFVATSYGFLSHSYGDDDDDVKGRLRVMVLGRHLPSFTRTILREGQAYYLVSMIFHIIYITQIFVSNPFAHPCSIGIPGLVLITTMSAHVYRNIRLGNYRDYTVTTPTLNKTIERHRNSASQVSRDLSMVFKTRSGIETEISRTNSRTNSESEVQGYESPCHLEGVEKKMDV